MYKLIAFFLPRKVMFSMHHNFSKSLCYKTLSPHKNIRFLFLSYGWFSVLLNRGNLTFSVSDCGYISLVKFLIVLWKPAFEVHQGPYLLLSLPLLMDKMLISKCFSPQKPASVPILLQFAAPFQIKILCRTQHKMFCSAVLHFESRQLFILLLFSCALHFMFIFRTWKKLYCDIDILCTWFVK